MKLAARLRLATREEGHRGTIGDCEGREGREDRRDPRPSLPASPDSARARRSLHAARGRRAVGAVQRRPRERSRAQAFRAGAHARADGGAAGRAHPGCDPLVRPRACESETHPRALTAAGGAPRRPGAGELRGTRSAAGRRSQDGERRAGAGLRHPGLPGRHAHPPARRALGTLVGPQRGADRARSHRGLPRSDLGQAALADHLLRAGALSGARA